MSIVHVRTRPGLRGPRPPDRPGDRTPPRRLLRPLLVSLHLLRRVHSGHVGDYIAWLFAGVALLGALLGLGTL